MTPPISNLPFVPGRRWPRWTSGLLPPPTPRRSLRSRTPNSSRQLPVHHHLAGIAALHGLEAGYVVVDPDTVRDQPGDVERSLHQRDHLVPGLEHLAAVD